MVQLQEDQLLEKQITKTAPPPLEIRIVLNLEYGTGNHFGNLVNQKEFDILIVDFPNIYQSDELKLFLSGSKEVKSRYGNYQIKRDISQFISYQEYRKIGGSERGIHHTADVPVRILTYECVDDWAQVVRQTHERIEKSVRLKEQKSGSQRIYPNPKVY